MSHFPLELTTGLYIRLWFSNLESILKKIISLGNQDEEIMDQYQYHNIMKLRPETKTKLNPETAKRYETSEICKTTEMIKTKRLERNEPNNQKKNDRNYQNSIPKKIHKNKKNALGCQASAVIFISFRLWSTPDLPHGEIQLSLYYHQLDVRGRGNHIENKITKKLTYIDVVNETVICFFPLLTLCYSIWLAFRSENCI